MEREAACAAADDFKETDQTPKEEGTRLGLKKVRISSCHSPLVETPGAAP